MNLVFNELSCLTLPEDEFTAKQSFLDVIDVFEHAKSEYGFQHFVFPSDIGSMRISQEKSLIELVSALSSGKERNTILGVISKRPFAADVLAADIGELNKYYYHNAEARIPETYCTGLAITYVKEALCASLSSAPIWDETKINFHKIINDDLETETVSVKNVSKKEHFNVEEIRNYIENLGQVSLLRTEIDPSNKPISLRDDSGKDKLKAFSQKIVRSEYVSAVINSLPFNPTSVNLIKAVYPDGKIEMVLYWEDKGIGIIIQTTGRNYRETEAISKILKKQFDR